jgi:Uncharacterized protein conserved in bacteria (DUF2314)
LLKNVVDTTLCDDMCDRSTDRYVSQQYMHEHNCISLLGAEPHMDNKICAPPKNMKRIILIITLFASLTSGCGANSTASPSSDRLPPLSDTVASKLPPIPTLSKDAPKDKVVRIRGSGQKQAYEAAIAPYIALGQKTYPDVKKRYLAGLPAGQHLFIVTKLRDDSQTSEQVFISVTSIQDSVITGRIASDITLLKGFKQNDPCHFSEDEVLDWVITRPDGSEEGNVVGKFMDKWHMSSH